LSPRNARPLLALPMVWVATGAGPIRDDERRTIESYARDELLFGAPAMRVVSTWLDERPSVAYFELGFDVLVAIMRASDEPTISPLDVAHVLVFCQTLADSFETERAVRGRAMVRAMAVRFQLDIGESWARLVGEELGLVDVGGGPKRSKHGRRQEGPAARRLLESARSSQADDELGESGGLI
jgi:hypothetical protein